MSLYKNWSQSAALIINSESIIKKSVDFIINATFEGIYYYHLGVSLFLHAIPQIVMCEESFDTEI